jgi:Cys-tRNA(Pro)/Cys-tRNA(Cys) deacylase
VARRERGTPATVALSRAGVAFTTHEYDHDPRQGSYGHEAATALGLSTSEVFKTLVATVDGTTVVAVVPVAGTLDLKALATAASGRRAEMCDPATAQRLTGYVIGGISPIGLKRPLPTYLDESALAFDRVYVSGGRRGLDIGLSPIDLVAVTAATCAPIGRG